MIESECDAKPALTVLIWHVHGSWTTSFVQGRHTYLLPLLPDAGPWGRGRCGRDWPGSVIDTSPDRLREAPVDVVVLQRPHEIELTEQWLGKRPGVDIPAVYVEHNAPAGPAASSRHPLADRADIPLVHVTHFNNVMWDNGICPTTVIRHGIVDPGDRYSGDLPHGATMINEPVRRMRVTGADLLAPLSAAAPIDVFGMETDDGWWAPGALRTAEDLFDAHPEVGLIAARTLVGPEQREDPTNQLMRDSPLGIAPGAPGPSVLGFLAGACVVRREPFRHVGGFSPVLHFAGEETLLAYDLAAAGWLLCYSPDVVSRHMPSARRPPARARRNLEARNAVLTTIMRRPPGECVRALGAAGVTALTHPSTAPVLFGIARRLPRALRERRRLPAHVEADIALLEKGVNDDRIAS